MYNVVTCVSVGSYPRITEFRDGHSAEKNSFLQWCYWSGGKAEHE